MTQYKKSFPKLEEISAWLNKKYSTSVTGLSPIAGGFWSAAYTFTHDSVEYVLRFNESGEGFAIDTAAMRFASTHLPVPEVTETGETLGLQYAISKRHYGQFIEETEAQEGDAVGSALAHLLVALRAAPTTKEDVVVWYDPDVAGDLTWRGWLTSGLIDNPDNVVSGWRAKLAAIEPIDTLFNTCEARIHELLPFCPERRDLIHGDLLHQNVLVSEDASEVTAIFSWKCSALGDFLYDVAWCTFWKDWHPGIAASDIWNRTLAAADLTQEDLRHARLRHHCYELQIGATHLGWNAWVDNRDDLEAVAAVLKRTLANGPQSPIT
ncbi:MAG: aminoglycoside phosphotransferase family protein [Chloroflexota bacterium]